MTTLSSTQAGGPQGFQAAGQTPQEFLQRHASGDWRSLSQDDGKENEKSLGRGFCLSSAYHLNNGITFWVVTEADRRTATFRLPSKVWKFWAFFSATMPKYTVVRRSQMGSLGQDLTNHSFWTGLNRGEEV